MNSLDGEKSNYNLLILYLTFLIFKKAISDIDNNPEIIRKIGR